MKVIDEETGEITPAKNKMTVQHLLTPEPGLIYRNFDTQSDLGRQYLVAGMERFDLNLDASFGPFDISSLEMAKNLAALPLRFELGTKGNYLRSRNVLGAVIEVAAGMSLNTLLKERIFDTLGWMRQHSMLTPLTLSVARIKSTAK